jgi:hypothetical protein
MRELYGSLLFGRFMGALWELFGSSSVDGYDVALLVHYHAASEQYS